MKTGFTLIELLIAIILTVSGLMALMHMLGIAIFADSDLEYSLTSLNLANEKLEELKNSDYSTIVSETESSIPGFPWVDNRIVTVSEISTDLKDVQVDVQWTQKGGQQTVNLHTYITNY